MATATTEAGPEAAPLPARAAERGGLRERKKQETRARLLAAAERLFGQHGFDAVTMAQVAALADVSRPTAFNYFPTKERLLVELHRAAREVQAVAIARIVARPPADPVALVVALLHTNVDTLGPARQRKLWREIVAATIRLQTHGDDEFTASQQTFEDSIRRALELCRDRGQLRRDMDLALAARTIFAINRHNLRKLIATPAMTLQDYGRMSGEQVAQLLEPWAPSTGVRPAKPGRGA